MQDNARELLAQRIRALRKLKGWSQEDLAEACGLHRTYIGGIERAERSVGFDMLARVACGLEITLAELVDFSASMPAQESGAGDTSNDNDGDSRAC